jgi:carbon-monoxide dehydrogenase large subunit
MNQPDRPRLFGARVRRVEDPRFLMGSARYVDDISLPGTLHVAFVRSTIPHGDVVGIDATEAIASPGVHRVIAAADIADRVRPIRCDSSDPSWQGSAYHILARDRVRFLGEAVAAVVAEDRYLAEDAAERVNVEYSPRAVISTIEMAIAPDAPRLYDDWRNNIFLHRKFVGGDPDRAFAEASNRLDLPLAVHRHTGIPLENRGCLARYDEASQILVLWTGTQIPHLVRTGLADCLGMPEHRLRVIAPDIGGGFGIKASLYPEEVAVSILASLTGRPVKWIEDRREHMLSSFQAREHHSRIEVAFDDAGLILGMRAAIYVDAGAYSVYPWTATLDAGQVIGALPGPYRIQDYECETFAVATNKSPIGPYRGVSLVPACFAMERTLDEIAVRLGNDPVEVRKRNMVRREEFPYTSVAGLVYDSGSFVESLDRVCEVAGYGELRKDQATARKAGRYLGIGVGCYTEQTSHTTSVFTKREIPIIFGYEAARVRVDPSGTVSVHLSTHSQGQGHETSVAQLVADRLGLALEDVSVSFGDTQSAPYGMGTFASRSAVLAGGAACRAADTIKELLVRIGAHTLEAAVEDVVLEGGAARIKGSPDRAISVAELARWAYHRPEKLPPGVEPLLEAAATYDADPGTGAFSNASHLAVVEIDVDTGRVTLLRYVVVEDCGRMINPLIVEGQVHGGVAQGVGGALLEELIYNQEGQLVTTTFLDYLLPGATDLPTITVDHLETPSPFTIGGIKGMGEGGSIAPGAAIAGAVQDALAPLGHVFVNEIPLTPERVRRFVEFAWRAPNRQRPRREPGPSDAGG